MQTNAQVTGGEAKDLTELFHINLLELAEYEPLGQRSRQAVEAAIQNAPELVVQ